jgi:transposase
MRAHAILLVKKSKSIQEVAALFFVDVDTIKNWVTRWNEKQKVKDASRPGASCKITKELEKEIVEMVEKNDLTKHGMFCSSWDCNELRIYL